MRTHDGEAHDLEDPDGEGEVHQDEQHEQQDEQVQAPLPLAVDAHLVDLGLLRALQRVPMRALVLGHLEGDRETDPELHRERDPCYKGGETRVTKGERPGLLRGRDQGY